MPNVLRAAAAVAALAWAAGGPWTDARPDYAWRFPRDHWAHPGYRTEWWYITGQLRAPGDTAPRLGYQFTIFRIGVAPRAPALASDWTAGDLVMGHAAITDFATGTHRFAEVLLRAAPLLGGFGAPGRDTLAWSLAPAGTAGRWTLRRRGEGFALGAADDRVGIAMQLAASPLRPLTLEGPNGYSRKGRAPGNASQYYSFTRLATSGTLTFGADTVPVTGTSWMDHEFGSNQLGPDAAGWDWFSLQLADGRDLMLYVLRDTTGASAWGGGTIVRPGAPPRTLALRDFTARASAQWTSPATHARYPSRWVVQVPGEGLRLVVEPLVADQENRSRIAPRLFYWEGAVRALDPGGREVGRGYVELTGYGAGLKPAI